MFDINNTGKVTLYNVTAIFEDDSIQKSENYIGNIKPGESGNVDAMIYGIAPTMDEGMITVKITYEDENGETKTVQLKSFVKNADGETPQRLGQKPDLRKAGEHRVTWDSAADNIRIKGKNVQLRLMACEGDER
jgi:hypothetical protein